MGHLPSVFWNLNQDVNSVVWDVSHTKLDGNTQESLTPWKRNVKPNLLYIIKPRKKPSDSELKQRNKLKLKYIKIKIIRIFKKKKKKKKKNFEFKKKKKKKKKKS